jgi:quinol monooxygenase YgiN
MIVIKAVAHVTADSVDPVAEQVREIRTRTLKRPGVIGYDFFQQDDDHVVALEVYENSDILLAHIDAGGFDELFKLIEVETIELMGPVSNEARSRFEALGNVAIYPSITEARVT